MHFGLLGGSAILIGVATAAWAQIRLFLSRAVGLLIGRRMHGNTRSPMLLEPRKELMNV